MTPAAAETFLLDLPRFADAGATAYAPGLDRVRALLAAMGDPHVGLPVVHVAGTNGKGSTASFVAAIGTASGRRVGLHTSPHLLTLRERMRVDGMPASPDWLADAVGRFEGAMRKIGPSFFEATVALSLLYFREQEVDLAVVEVGLGGRLDATNVVEPVVCLVTHIGLDHTDLLGETLSEIAREKAGIAKPGVLLLHAVDDSVARASLTTKARELGAGVEAVRDTAQVRGGTSRTTITIRHAITDERREVGPVHLGHSGQHQSWNAALAMRAAQVAMPDVDRQSVEHGLRDVVRLAGLRGRGERWAVDPRIILDVAHNDDGWKWVLYHFRGQGRAWLLFGAMADKDQEAMRDLFYDCGEKDAVRILFADLPTPRALPAADLARLATEAWASAETFQSVAEALTHFRREAGPHDQLLVTGSHVTVAEALKVLEGPGSFEWNSVNG